MIEYHFARLEINQSLEASTVTTAVLTSKKNITGNLKTNRKSNILQEFFGCSFLKEDWLVICHLIWVTRQPPTWHGQERWPCRSHRRLNLNLGRNLVLFPLGRRVQFLWCSSDLTGYGELRDLIYWLGNGASIPGMFSPQHSKVPIQLERGLEVLKQH